MASFRGFPLAIIRSLVLITLASGTSAVATEPDAVVTGDGGTVRVLAIPFGTNSFPPFVIQKFGLDRKYRFALQIVPAATTQAQVTALQASGADIGILDWIDVSRMKNAGIKGGGDRTSAVVRR